MKKVSAKFMLMEGIILIAISFIAGLAVSYFMGAVDLMFSTIWMGGFILFVLALLYCSCCNSITGKIAKKICVLRILLQ